MSVGLGSRSSGRLDEQALTRKRFARRQWARRWMAWRPIVALLLLLALVAGAIWLVFFSTVLTVKGVQVEGTRSLTTAQVLQTARVPEGEPLARVDVSDIRARVRAMAPVKAVDVSRAWPDRIRIEVTERVAVGVVEVGSRYKAVDDEGVLFRDYPDRPAKLPLITATAEVEGTGGTDRTVMKEAATAAAALPRKLMKHVDHIEVESIDRISLAMEDGKTVVWGSAEQSADKARVLAFLLKNEPDYTTYDVSVPGRPTTR